MSGFTEEAAELRYLMACLDLQVPGVTQQDVAKTLAEYAVRAMASRNLTGVQRQELTQWMERFSSSAHHKDAPGQGIFESPTTSTYRALFRREDALRAMAKKDPAHRREIEEHISAEQAAVHRASDRLRELTRGDAADTENDLDDEDWDEEDEEDTEVDSGQEPVPDELHIGRRGPTVSGGLPHLGRRRR
ncbi:hypothetical protein EU811_00805 [Arthrobacter sp. TS-15]|uniref:hypothetical protein n=1 Tax=Arthrobacter sp. TS-15 TaxID=2510797 RepID=UPI00115EC44D|nr:hypothetical protein [Arthrobacter sp. TS-15]TQS94360.1 hypothetical protein EU811_00805 [Arthrobacter sp. TS-15]